MTSDGERARGAAVFFKTKPNQNLFQISTHGKRKPGGRGGERRQTEYIPNARIFQVFAAALLKERGSPRLPVPGRGKGRRGTGIPALAAVCRAVAQRALASLPRSAQSHVLAPAPCRSSWKRGSQWSCLH